MERPLSTPARKLTYDPEAETVKVYRLDQGTYGRPELLLAERGDALSSPLFGDHRLPLERVFL